MIFKVVSLLLSAFFLYTYGYAEQYNESPMLKRLVKAGKIPSVDDRLPLEPYIVEGDKLVTNFPECLLSTNWVSALIKDENISV